jgi:hypothetical protein
MNIRSFHIVPIIASVITALVTGCGSVSTSAPAAGQPDPVQADITVAALPAADLAGLYIALDQGLFARQVNFPSTGSWRQRPGRRRTPRPSPRSYGPFRPDNCSPTRTRRMPRPPSRNTTT